MNGNRFQCAFENYKKMSRTFNGIWNIFVVFLPSEARAIDAKFGHYKINSFYQQFLCY